MNAETAKRLLEFRKANGYSQEDLAEKLGVSRQAISNWERNESSPDTDNLIALAQLYDVSIDELLKGKDKPVKNETESKQNSDTCEETSQQYGEYKENKKTAHISFKDGVHVHDGDDHVDVGWDGIHIETKNGEYVDMNKEQLHNHIHEKMHDSVNTKNSNIWLHTLLPIFAVTFYLIVGFTCGGSGWARGWLVFLLIPIIESTVSAVQKRNPSSFCYPVFATFLFLFFGFFFGIWHPTWIVFVTIPAFYAICSAFKKTDANKNAANTNNNNSNGSSTYYTPQGTGVVDETKTKSSAKPIVAIILAAICAVTVICVVAIVGAFSFMQNLPFDEIIPYSNVINYDDEKSYSLGNGTANNVSNIEIEWISGEINLEHYDGDNISFKETTPKNDDYTMRYRVSDNTLYIKFCKSGLKSSTATTLSKDLTILVPNNISFDELEISTVSAPVNIKDITADELEIDYVSGDVTATGNYGSISANGVSGKFELHNTAERFNCDIDTVSGNCRLYLPENISGFTCDFDAISGNISTQEFDGFKSSKSFSDTTHRYGDGSVSIEFDAVSGNLDIVKSAAQATP